MLAIIATGFGTLIALSVAAFYVHRRRAHSYFAKLGISGPKPQWILGNLAKMAGEFHYAPVIDWTKEFGKVYGYFEGSTPILVVSDVELIKAICIKHFSVFHSRRPFPFTPDSQSEIINMFTAEGSRWKRLRAMISPSFTSGKLASIKPMMNGCISNLMEYLSQRPAQPDMSETYKKLSLDVIGECCYGIPGTSFEPNAKKNIVLEKMEAVLKEYIDEIPLRTIFSIIFNELYPTIRNFYVWYWTNLPTWLTNDNSALNYKIVSDMVIQREQEAKSDSANKRTQCDIMYELLKHEIAPDYPSLKAKSDNGDELCPRTKNMTTRWEVVGQSYLLLIAGHETASTTMQFATHLLAKHPEIQDKLFQDLIDENDPESSSYLDWVVKETLRLYPVATPALTRIATQTIKISENLEIPAGCNVCIDAYSVHRDIDVWGEDAAEFKPERWDCAGDDQGLFLAFGLGRRNCVGMRFAMQELKLALAEIFSTYRITPGPNFDHSAQLISGVVIHLKNPLSIVLEKRETRKPSSKEDGVENSFEMVNNEND